MVAVRNRLDRLDSGDHLRLKTECNDCNKLKHVIFKESMPTKHTYKILEFKTHIF